MSLIDIIGNSLKEKEIVSGVVIGLVTDTADPEGMGRIKVRYPLMGEDIESDWIRMVSFFAGKDRGAFFLPQPEDEVLIAFAYGNVNLPYVIGALWNGVDLPPVEKDQQQNMSAIKTRSGSVISFDDTENQEKITITDAKQNQIIIETNNGKITINANQDITINAKGNMTINAQNLQFNVGTKCSLKAEKIDIEATGSLTLKGSMIDLN